MLCSCARRDRLRIISRADQLESSGECSRLVAEHHAAVLPVSWFISEVALALILMIGAGLMIESFRALAP